MSYKNEKLYNYSEDQIVEELIKKFGESSNSSAYRVKSIYSQNRKIIDDLNRIVDKYEGVDASIQDMEKSVTEFVKQRSLARDLQSTIFPTILPDNNFITVSAKILPMDETSGDFYDIFEVVKNEVYGVMLSDISGHGVSASLITYLAKVLFTQASERYSSPNRVMAYVNSEFCSILKQKSYFTSVCTLIDFPNGRIVHCSAGHPYALKYSMKTNSVVELPVQNMVVGIGEGRKFEQEIMKLDVGDRIILYTDGISEAKNSSNEMYGDNRLKKLLIEYKNTPTKELLDIILYEIRSFTGRDNFDDDVTMVMIDIKSDEYMSGGTSHTKTSLTKNESERMIDYYKKSIDLKESHNDKLGMIGDMVNLAKNLMEKGNKDECLHYFDKAEDIAVSIDDSPLVGNLFISKGRYYLSKGEFDDAEKYFNKANKYCNSIGDKIGLSLSYNNLFIVCVRKGYSDKAPEYIQKAIEIEKEGDPSPGNMMRLADYYNNLAVILIDEDQNKSLEYFRESSKIAEKYGNLQLLSTTRNNIGSIYIQLDRMDDSLDELNYALSILEEIDLPQMLSLVYFNIGMIFYYRDEIELSIYYLKKSLRVAKKNQLWFDESRIRIRLAHVLAKSGNIFESIKNILEILNIYDKINIIENESLLNLTLGILVYKYFKMIEIPTDKNTINLEKLKILYEKLNMKIDIEKNFIMYFEKAVDLSKEEDMEGYIESLYEYAYMLYTNEIDTEMALRLFKESFRIAREENYILFARLIREYVISILDVDLEKNYTVG